MPKQHAQDAFYDPRRGGEALDVERISLPVKPTEPPRTNCFTVYRIEAGSGTVWADAAQHAFGPDLLIFFVPYQYVRFVPERPVTGDVIRFHANFLCVETFHAEVGCSGVLFNDPYGSPVVPLAGRARAEIAGLIARIRTEQTEGATASAEVSLAYLKVLLILAARLKAPRVCGPGGDCRHPVVEQLREMIEANYCTMHAPAEYAAAMHMTPKTLGRIVREQLGATPTDLIRARVLTHAKWQLLHTLKPVNQVARELGFGDELYFSRLFKKATGVSPTYFREFETEIRGGSNLSMFSGDAPIPRTPAAGR